MTTDKTIAYGVRQSWSGQRTTVVRVTEREEYVRIGDLCGRRRVVLHRGIKSFSDAELAAVIARDLAVRENVPYVGYGADRL